ncbi:hypothetical protein TRFO_05717 [Tritrichomonas foetus]|uniref:Rab-GAP TBC domain-containing protein n=1 Tax=Tritrichomonas foetus TaxID=1144522 RepID=A0A1J4K9D7_9EUKA|nr:hypothetical protein TRFO_05717 [Tritrichomonas foetus]|eukprot:OHT06061.1 hypothetical protein TRFO_05717 [Tritrichomonas foetus]
MYYWSFIILSDLIFIFLNLCQIYFFQIKYLELLNLFYELHIFDVFDKLFKRTIRSMKVTQVIENSIRGKLDLEFIPLIPGIFSVELYDNEIYLFRWIPEKHEPFDLAKSNFQEAQVYFLLHQIQSIHISKEDEHKIFLRFAIPKLPTSVRFLFTNESIKLIDQCIEYLKNSQLIYVNPNYPHIYNVKVKCTRSFIFPSDYISLSQLICFSTHYSIFRKYPLPKMKKSKMSLSNFNSYVYKDGKISKYSKLQRRVFEYGMNDDIRPYVWSYLLGYYQSNYTNDQKKEEEEKKFLEYKDLLSQTQSEIQFQYDCNQIKTIIRNDVARTEKSDSFFKDLDSLARKMMIRILINYNAYNKDVGYVQGMCDLARPFFTVFIKDITDENNIKIYNDKWVDRDHAESLIYWHFVGFLKLGGQEAMFSSMAENQMFFAERAFAIAKNNHPLLGQWLIAHNLSDLLFLYSSFLLQFKRYFPMNQILQLWDAIYSSDNPSVFLRFFVAATLFILFPYIASSQSTDNGSIMILVGNTLDKIDIKEIIILSKQLYMNAKENPAQSEWYFMELPSPHERVTNYPKYFKLKTFDS